MSNRPLLLSACLIVFVVFASIARAEPAWVTDQFEVLLRTGPTTDNAIVRMLGSGARLEVLERDEETGYSRVRTAGGTEGWVLTRYLMGEPAAREQLQQLTGELTNATAEGSSLGSQLQAIKSEYDNATRRIATLEGDNKALQSELDRIRKTAADVLAIDDQNKNLRQDCNAETRMELLWENRPRQQTNRNWFITGALVLLGGIGAGLLLPHMRFQRRSRYERF
jgi:SH3 domain protein